jgi:hypothetical protein
MKIITGHQPLYLPWLGFFHKVSLADTFVFLDDVQYLTKSWNNRNHIKGPQGSLMLSVPIDKRASRSNMLQDIRIDSSPRGRAGQIWQDKHWQSLRHSYANAPYWKVYSPFFEYLYRQRRWECLVELNLHMLQYLLKVLHIEVELVRATEMGFAGRKSNLVLDVCRRLKADLVVFGAMGRNYVVADDFYELGVSIYFQDYRHPTYPQRFGDYISHLAVLDLLFNCGPDSLAILLSGNVDKAELLQAWHRLDQPQEIIL